MFWIAMFGAYCGIVGPGLTNRIQNPGFWDDSNHFGYLAYPRTIEEALDSERHLSREIVYESGREAYLDAFERELRSFVVESRDGAKWPGPYGLFGGEGSWRPIAINRAQAVGYYLNTGRIMGKKKDGGKIFLLVEDDKLTQVPSPWRELKH